AASARITLPLGVEVLPGCWAIQSPALSLAETVTSRLSDRFCVVTWRATAVDKLFFRMCRNHEVNSPGELPRKLGQSRLASKNVACTRSAGSIRRRIRSDR